MTADPPGGPAPEPLRPPGRRGVSTRAPWVFAAALGLLSLWDFYWGPFGQGIRPFDFAGVGLLFTGLLGQALVGSRSQAWFHTEYTPALMLLCAMLFAAVVGGLLASPATNVKVAIGITIGILLLAVLHSWALSPLRTVRVIDALIVLHAFALMLQALVFLIQGSVLNYHGLFGDEPRVLGRLFRPSGLFLEPAHFALFIYLLLAVRLRLRRALGWAGVIGVASVVMSLSLFGILATTLLCAFYYWRTPAFWWFTILTAVVVGLNTDRLLDSRATAFVLDRLATLTEDPSALQRFSGFAAIVNDLTSRPGFLIGRGFSNDYERYGQNGLAFLLNGIGFVGTLLFVTLFTVMAGPRRFWAMVVLAVALGAAPRWTIWFWWVWLGLMTNPSLVANGRARGAVS